MSYETCLKPSFMEKIHFTCGLSPGPLGVGFPGWGEIQQNRGPKPSQDLSFSCSFVPVMVSHRGAPREWSSLLISRFGENITTNSATGRLTYPIKMSLVFHVTLCKYLFFTSYLTAENVLTIDSWYFSQEKEAGLKAQRWLFMRLLHEL